MGQCSPESGNEWGAPLGRVSSPSALLLACRWWGYGWSRWGNAGWEMQMERCRWDQMQMGQMQKAPPQRGRGKRNGCTTPHLLGNSPMPLFSLCGFYIITRQGFGASKTPKQPQIQLMMLSGVFHVLNPILGPWRGWNNSFLGLGI